MSFNSGSLKAHNNIYVLHEWRIARLSIRYIMYWMYVLNVLFYVLNALHYILKIEGIDNCLSIKNYFEGKGHSQLSINSSCRLQNWKSNLYQDEGEVFTEVAVALFSSCSSFANKVEIIFKFVHHLISKI